MINRTIEEIESKAREIWPGGADSIAVSIRHDGAVLIKMSSMYHAPGVSFEKLSALSDFMETKKIDDEDHYSIDGCDTCDYGSEYGFTLVVGP